MEYRLLGDALKKIPNEPHLINAQLTVLKKVGSWLGYCKLHSINTDDGDNFSILLRVHDVVKDS